MKKNWFFRLGAAVLMMSIITLSLVSGTFAKYTKAIVGNPEDVAAAKFDFNLKDTAVGATYTTGADFNIFHYSNDAVWGNGDLHATSELVAPGASGSLPLYIENLSQVDTTLVINLTQTGTDNIPIYYTVDKGATPVLGTQRYSDVLTGFYNATDSYLPLSDLAIDLSEPLPATNGVDVVADVNTRTYTIHWTWLYENVGPGDAAQQVIDLAANDLIDTGLGIAANVPATLPTITLAISATVTQVI